MRIKLLKNLPFEKEYGLIEGRRFTVTRVDVQNKPHGYWVQAKNGREVKVLRSECTITKYDKETK